MVKLSLFLRSNATAHRIAVSRSCVGLELVLHPLRHLPKHPVINLMCQFDRFLDGLAGGHHPHNDLPFPSQPDTGDEARPKRSQGAIRRFTPHPKSILRQQRSLVHPASVADSKICPGSRSSRPVVAMPLQREPKTVLRLPDLEQAKSAVLNSQKWHGDGPHTLKMLQKSPWMARSWDI